MTDSALTVIPPANEAFWEDLQTVSGARGDALPAPTVP
jgi:hypothetical protein